MTPTKYLDIVKRDVIGNYKKKKKKKVGLTVVCTVHYTEGDIAYYELRLPRRRHKEIGRRRRRK
jgi:hypothetical protein